LSQPSAAGSGHRKLAFLLLSLGVLGAAATAQQEIAPAPVDTVVVNGIIVRDANGEATTGYLVAKFVAKPTRQERLAALRKGMSQDLFKIAPSEIGKTELLLTMVGGKIVYQSPRWVAAASRSASATEGKH